MQTAFPQFHCESQFPHLENGWVIVVLTAHSCWDYMCPEMDFRSLKLFQTSDLQNWKIINLFMIICYSCSRKLIQRPCSFCFYTFEAGYQIKVRKVTEREGLKPGRQWRERKREPTSGQSLQLPSWGTQHVSKTSLNPSVPWGRD